ncbi:Homing endonuclease [uncultured virus]|nr:Homing endonuclease [uncultured virus]
MITNMNIDLETIKQNQPTINIGMIGSVSNGKSTITEKITSIKTQKYSKELEKNITIKLGYANTKIFKCPDCQNPKCYQSFPSEVYEAKCKFCDCGMKLLKHISIVDCFDPSTKVMMFDGSSKIVSELKKNDLLMGPDGKQRKILKFVQGTKELYEIKYKNKKKNSLDENQLTCTSGHLLVLRIDTPVDYPSKISTDKYLVRIYSINNKTILSSCFYFKTNNEAINFYKNQNKDPITFEMTVETFLNCPVTLKKKANMFYSSCLEFNDKHNQVPNISIKEACEEEIAWLIGLWMGDGYQNNQRLYLGFNNQEVLNKLKLIADKIGLIPNFNKKNCVFFAINKNPFIKLLDKLNLLTNKKINFNIKFQKKSIRLAILAGMIDSNGYSSNNQLKLLFNSENKSMFDGVLWIIRSLGFTCNLCNIMPISINKKKIQKFGITIDGICSQLPIVSDKKIKYLTKKNPTSQRFSIIKKSFGKYNGFEIDKDGKFLLNDFIVAHNCPGHNLLMATMLNGTCVMDTSILVEAANNNIPAPQTSEHLVAANIIGLKNSIVCLNKSDLVNKEKLIEQINLLNKYISTTIAKNSPILPISGNYGINIDVLCEYICTKIPEPEKQFDSDLKMVVIRSFNINHPNVNIRDLEGGVVGGTILKGNIKIGDQIKILPGLIKDIKQNDKKWQYKPLISRIHSINSEKNNLTLAIPGGLIGVKLTIDPALTAKDRLVGNIVININSQDSYLILEELFLLLELLEDRKTNLKKDDVIIINSNASNTKGKIKIIKKKKAVIELLEKPLCVQLNDYITLSKFLDGSNIMLIGRAKVVGGTESTLI